MAGLVVRGWRQQWCVQCRCCAPLRCKGCAPPQWPLLWPPWPPVWRLSWGCRAQGGGRSSCYARLGWEGPGARGACTLATLGSPCWAAAAGARAVTLPVAATHTWHACCPPPSLPVAPPPPLPKPLPSCSLKRWRPSTSLLPPRTLMCSLLLLLLLLPPQLHPPPPTSGAALPVPLPATCAALRTLGAMCWTRGTLRRHLPARRQG